MSATPAAGGGPGGPPDWLARKYSRQPASLPRRASLPGPPAALPATAGPGRSRTRPRRTAAPTARPGISPPPVSARPGTRHTTGRPAAPHPASPGQPHRRRSPDAPSAPRRGELAARHRPARPAWSPQDAPAPGQAYAAAVPRRLVQPGGGGRPVAVLSSPVPAQPVTYPMRA